MISTYSTKVLPSDHRNTHTTHTHTHTTHTQHTQHTNTHIAHINLHALCQRPHRSTKAMRRIKEVCICSEQIACYHTPAAPIPNSHQWMSLQRIHTMHAYISLRGYHRCHRAMKLRERYVCMHVCMYVCMCVCCVSVRVTEGARMA